MTLRSLISGCWLSHGEIVRDRDEGGRLILRCVECGSFTPVLQADEGFLKGPRLYQGSIAGQPTGKAKRASWFQRKSA